MTFRTLLDRRVTNDPSGSAITDSSRRLTNRQLAQEVHDIAAALHERGIGAGDVVAVALRNRADFVVLLFAAWRLGAVITPVNPASTSHEVLRQVTDSHAALTVVEEDAAFVDADLATIHMSDLVCAGAALPDPVYGDADLALLIYTSGSTGTPKGVMLDHRNLDAMTSMAQDALRLTPADVSLLILPLFHVNGIVVSVLSPLRAGASVVIADRFDPRTFFDTVETHRPTFFSAVPTIITMLSALPEDVTPDTSSVRFAVCGAAPASAELLSRFEQRYDIALLEGYGLSETTCGATINPLDGVRKVGTVGVPFPGVDICIVGPDGHDVGLGEDGEVAVRGPNVMRGYLGRPEDTAHTIVDGWLYTGDVGTLDADGYLTLVGRKKDMIIRAGENIFPKEIEDVLSSDPAVLEAAVLGVPDAKWGEIVVALVTPRANITIDLDSLAQLCRTRLSRYKVPAEIHAVDALPKNSVGKLDRRSLGALIAVR